MSDIFINLGITVVLQLLKDKKKAEFKKALLKVRNAINTAFTGDPDFQ